MFGYVRVYEDELKIKEYNRYKHFYCELCRNMGSFSELSRFFHSYDLVFYYMLCYSDELSTCNLCNNKKRIFKCQSCKGDSTTQYFAALSIALIYHKLNNDVLDGEKSKVFLRFLVNKAYLKTLNVYPEIGKTIEQGLNGLVVLEREQCSDYDYLSMFFGKIVSDASKGVLGNECEDTCKYDIIRLVSACVYLIDVLDDSIKDYKKGDFNPLNLSCNGIPTNTQSYEFKELIMSKLGQANNLLTIIPYYDNLNILKNIVGFGMPFKLNQIYDKHISLKNKYLRKMEK